MEHVRPVIAPIKAEAVLSFRICSRCLSQSASVARSFFAVCDDRFGIPLETCTRDLPLRRESRQFKSAAGKEQFINYHQDKHSLSGLTKTSSPIEVLPRVNVEKLEEQNRVDDSGKCSLNVDTLLFMIGLLRSTVSPFTSGKERLFVPKEF